MSQMGARGPQGSAGSGAVQLGLLVPGRGRALTAGRDIGQISWGGGSKLWSGCQPWLFITGRHMREGRRYQSSGTELLHRLLAAEKPGGFATVQHFCPGWSLELRHSPTARMTQRHLTCSNFGELGLRTYLCKEAGQKEIGGAARNQLCDESEDERPVVGPVAE